MTFDVSRLKRKRWYLIAVVLLVWLVCFWGLRARHPDDDGPEVAQNAATAQRSPDRTTKPGHANVARPALGMPAMRNADLIASVEVDNPRPCSGESFLVSIRGKPENAASSLPISELNYNIGGSFGDAIALSANTPGTQQYTVVASNGVDALQHRAFKVEVLPLEALECRDKAIVTLALEHSKRDPNEVFAHVSSHTGLQEPLQFDWDFGDGSHAQSALPSTSHSYALRAQNRSLSSYLVAVHVTDARRRSAKGRATIHLLNNHYRARMFGARLVQAVYSPFVERAADGYRVEVTLRSFEPEPVVFERAKLTERSCLAGQRDRTHELSISELTATLRLEPEQPSSVSLLLPRSRVGDETCAVELELTGDTLPPRTGEPMPNAPIKLRAVTSRLSLDIKAAPSVQQGGAPTLARRAVHDPALLQRLQRASKILGSGRVTPAQLDELERDGRLPP
jgi:hypothetical protein